MNEPSRKKSDEFVVGELDEAILRLLEVDGRMAKSSIAASLGVSRAVVTERIARLVDTGAVEVVAVPNPSLLGIGWMGYALIEVDGPIRPAAELLSTSAAVPFCSIVTGSAPLRAEIRADTTESAARTTTWIRGLPGVRAVEVTQYLEVIRDVVAPTGAISTRVDGVDRRILAELQLDGRLSLTDLAAKVRRSPTSTRDRLTRLREGRAVRIGAVLRHGAPFGRRAMGVGLRLTGDEKEVFERLSGMTDLLFAARTLGRFDTVLTLRAGSALGLHEVVENLRGWPGVRSADSWIHLDIVKEQYFGGAAPLR